MNLILKNFVWRESGNQLPIFLSKWCKSLVYATCETSVNLCWFFLDLVLITREFREYFMLQEYSTT